MQDINITSASIQIVNRQYYISGEGRLPGLHPHECGQQGDKIVLPVKKRQQQKTDINRLISILCLGIDLHLRVVKLIVSVNNSLILDNSQLESFQS